mmetsp:Transcript_14174/g.21379  ORF Transcript_14174/g.21379 Transcript_14174/m.21379 type:complete len:203 (-) Transcript_14174:29-637(-)
MDHKSKDAHLSSTSIVQFNGTLFRLHLIAHLVPPKVQGTVTEITRELGGALPLEVLLNTPRPLIAVGSLENGKAQSHLRQHLNAGIGLGEGAPRGEAGGNVLGAGEANAGVGHEVTHHGEHGHASVLDLDSAETVEFGLFGIFHEAEGVEESEGLLGADLAGEVGAEGGLGLGEGGWSECGGGAGEGGEEGELHHDVRSVYG